MCVCLCVVCATLTWQAAVGSQWTFQFFIDALCENCCRRQFIWEYFHCDSPSCLLFIFSRFDFNEMCLISSARTKLLLTKAFCWCASKSSDAKVWPALMMRATCTTTYVEYKVLWICTEYIVEKSIKNVASKYSVVIYTWNRITNPNTLAEVFESFTNSRNLTKNRTKGKSSDLI